jgi:hypothetical protein
VACKAAISFPASSVPNPNTAFERHPSHCMPNENRSQSRTCRLVGRVRRSKRYNPGQLWRRRPCLVGATLSLLAGVSCSSDGDAPPATVPLCDGSANLTLRIFYGGQSGRELFGSAVRVENGFPSFAVDGQCQYFISGGWFDDLQARDFGWRQGSLVNDLRDTLEANAGVEDLRSTYDCGRAVPVADAPPAIIANARSSLICVGGTSEPVGNVFALIVRRARELWAGAQPLDGGLHVTVREASGAEPPRWYPWPTGLRLLDYFETNSDILYDAPEGRSRPVAAMDAAPLRALREEYLRDTQGAFATGDGIPITDGETLGAMFMRDALPHENERGLWPLPEEMR